MTVDLTALARAVRDLADCFYRVDREWDAARDGLDEADWSAINRAIGSDENFPFSQSLEDTSALVAGWAERVKQVAANPPGLLDDVAALIRDDVKRVRTSMAKDDDTVGPDVTYRKWQYGGLGGDVGEFGAAMHPGVALNLAGLLDAVQSGDLTSAKQTAAALALEYRHGRKNPS